MISCPTKGWSPPLDALSRIASLTNRFCLISGSEEFVFQTIQALPPAQKFICSLDLDYHPSERLQHSGQWFPMRHIHHGGGVTCGTWWFGTNDKQITSPDPKRSALRLGHVLSDIKGGIPTIPPTNPDAYFDAVTCVSATRSLHVCGLLPGLARRNLRREISPICRAPVGE